MQSNEEVSDSVELLNDSFLFEEQICFIPPAFPSSLSNLWLALTSKLGNKKTLPEH